MANRASAIGPATTDRLVLEAAEMAVNAFMMPHTVPKANEGRGGTDGGEEAEPLLQRLAFARDGDVEHLFERPCTPMNEEAFCSWLRFHSFIAATKMAPRPGDGRSLICW